MNEWKSLILQVVMELQGIAELFYQQKEGEGNARFAEVLTVLEQLLGQLYSSKASTGTPEFDSTRLLSTFSEAVQAMEAKDTVLLADILQYDLSEQLQEIAEQYE